MLAAVATLRPVPDDALRLARRRFLAGQRVDMSALASELGINRVTLYRWFGSREQLLEQVLLGRIETFIAQAREESHGSGDERLLDTIRRIVQASARAAPVRLFIEREPTLALRILASEHGEVHRYLVEESLRDLAGTRTPAQVRALRARVDATLQLVTALLWVSVAIGEEPPAERIESLVAELLDDGAAGRRRRG